MPKNPNLMKSPYFLWINVLLDNLDLLAMGEIKTTSDQDEISKSIALINVQNQGKHTHLMKPYLFARCCL